MSKYQLVIQQAPRIHISPNKESKYIAQIALVVIVTEPCDSAYEATEAVITARQEVLRDPHLAIELLRTAPDMGA